MAEDGMRVPGIDVWRDRFAEDGDRYVVIGGAARELVYVEHGAWEDTATKDLDVVLIAEAIDAGFVSRFMSFVREGGYSHVTKSGDTQLYRFSQPTDASFPQQVELLCRRPDYLVGVEAVVGKVLVDDAEYSLSAILLDDDYYSLLASGVAVTRRYGIPTLSWEYLPVFKMRAFDDLADRRARGEAVRSGEVGKHRRDVVRLMAIMPAGTKVELPERVRSEVERFLRTVEEPSRTYMRSLGLGGISFADVMERIREVYL